MKGCIKHIIILFIILLSQSCLKENFNNCADWGKFKVIFHDSSNLERPSISYVTLLYSGVDSNSTALLKSYVLKPYSLLLDSPSVLKLLPGEYNFCALLSSDTIIQNSRIRLKNGVKYFYTSTKKQIRKLPSNKVPLFFNLANSIIAIECSLDSNLNNYKVKQIEISPPQEKDALLDITNGICGYESQTSDYFENTQYNSKEDVWLFYCNPIIPGNNLTIKITLIDGITNNTDKTLITKVFLEAGLEQGRVYKLSLNVTPYKIEYLSSSIIDWIDYNHYEEIVL